MRIPEFTAEASLSRTSREYRAVMTPASANGVIPQVFCYVLDPFYNTKICCEYFYGTWICWQTGVGQTQF